MYVYVSTKCQQTNELLRKNSKKIKSDEKFFVTSVYTKFLPVFDIAIVVHTEKRGVHYCGGGSRTRRRSRTVAVAGGPEFVVAGSSRARHGASRIS
jgi:hypothetical protein